MKITVADPAMSGETLPGPTPRRRAAPPLTFMFSGQGSQYFQMGSDLYARHAVFREALDEGSELVRQHTGRSLIAEITAGTLSQPFDDLRSTHPALLVIQHAMYRALLSEGVVPDEVWGSSLGEFVAAVAAGVWSFGDAIRAVIEQARLVTLRCNRGGMLAILAPPELHSELSATGYDLTLAGVNFASHFVVAGDARVLDLAQQWLTRRQIVFQRLPVHHAFHSSWIEPIGVPFREFCASLRIERVPRLRFISTVHGRDLAEVTSEYLWSVVREPMRFRDAAQLLERGGPRLYIDCGATGTGATFVRNNLRPGSLSRCFQILTPYQRATSQLQQLKEHLAQYA
jgi:bacillaene synthase trans-acting acyltransferase